MAARKKAKTKAKRKKTSARKPAARKKAVKARKVAPRRAAPKKAAAPRAVARPQAVSRPAAAPRPVRPAGIPAGAPAPAVTGPREDEERVGVVTHYYSHLSVAVLRLESGSLRVGDIVHIRGHTSDFRQRVDSMQIEHESVEEAEAGEEFGLKVREHAREHDIVYKVIK